MAKKKGKRYKQPEKETTIENFYDIKSKEMDELVAALNENTADPTTLPSKNIAEVTGEAVEGDKKKKKEFDPYRRGRLMFIPAWIKALFVKFWFFGLVCYFVLMGLGTYFIADTDGLSETDAVIATMTSNLELFLLCGILTGVVVDCFVNPIFRLMESDEKEYDKFMMFPFPFKQFWTFFTNIIYYIIVMCGVGLLFSLVFSVVEFSGIEPLGFGLACLVVDMAFIGIKDLIVFLIKRAVRKSREKKAMRAEGV